MDVIDHISKNPALPDGDATLHVLGGPRLHEFLAEMHREVFAERDGELLTVGEMPSVTVAEAALFTDPERAELDMVFQFEHVGLDHGTTKWDVRSATCLGTLLHLHRGTPYVYQGEELGMTNAPFGSITDFADIEALLAYAERIAAGLDADLVLEQLRSRGRDNARTPMQWDASPHAGFTSGTPWLPVNPNHVDVNAADARADEQSVFHHYRRLIALRLSEPVVAHGDFTMLMAGHEHVYALTRRLDAVELLVLSHVSGADQPVDVGAGWQSAELLLGNVGDPPTDVLTALRPWESRVLWKVGNPPDPDGVEAS